MAFGEERGPGLQFAVTSLLLCLLLGAAMFWADESVPASVRALARRDRCVRGVELGQARAVRFPDLDSIRALPECAGVEVLPLGGSALVIRATWIDWAAFSVRETSTRIALGTTGPDSSQRR